MSRRLRVEHRTLLTYDGPVLASYNEVRMTTRTEPRQVTLESRVDVSPVTWRHTYWDYWGSQVTAFETVAPHSELDVRATSTVEVDEPPALDLWAGAGADWAGLRSERVADRFCEWLTPTPATDPGPEAAAIAAEEAGGLAPREAALAVSERLRDEMRYEPGATGVHTSAAQAWAERRGVCQDMAHLTIGGLRSIGVPARYVSGYLHEVTRLA